MNTIDEQTKRTESKNAVVDAAQPMSEKQDSDLWHRVAAAFMKAIKQKVEQRPEAHNPANNY